MPLLWRYILGQYIKVLVTCVIALLAVLLSARLDEIVRFASSGAAGKTLLLFSLYQIPYILPIVIPIGALVSSLLLSQRMSQHHEFTALKSCGIGLWQVIVPLLVAGGALALFNLYVVSEWATQSHLATRLLQNELQKMNPLLVLQNNSFLKSQGISVHLQGQSAAHEQITDLVAAIPNRSRGSLNLLLAKELRYQPSPKELHAKDITFIAGQRAENINDNDLLWMDHAESMSMPLQEIWHLFMKDEWRLSPDHLTLPLLLVRIQEVLPLLKKAEQEASSQEEVKFLQAIVYQGWTEISRRLSLGAAAFVFSFMGVAFGMNAGRRTSIKGISAVIGLSLLYLACFFLAKGYSLYFVTATSLYTIPLLLILLLSYLQVQRISRGVT